MTKPEFKQFFESFRGKDELGSSLGRGLDSAIEFKNLEKLANGSIRGRQGLKICSQPLQVIAIHPYSYLDTDEVLQEELLGIAAFEGYTSGGNWTKYFSLVKHTTGTLNIVYTGGGTPSYAITNTENNIVFTLSVNGVSVLTSNLGSGYSSSDMTLQALSDLITALADFTCTVSKTAIVNGTQSSVVAITVDSGHTFSLGDSFYFRDRKSGNPYHRIAEVIATTGTTITINTDSVYTNVTVNDNDVIGHGVFPAASLDLFDLGYSINTWSLPFGVWEPVKSGIDGLYLGEWIPERYETLPSFENQRNCAYFTAPYFRKVNTIAYSSTSGTEPLRYESGVWKYDGVRYYLSGFAPEATIFLSPTNGGAGTVEAGVHIYSGSIKRIDAQGNEIEWFQTESNFYYNASATDVDIEVYADLFSVEDHNFISANLTADTTTDVVLTITSGHRFRTGDYVYFKNSSDQTLTRKVTAFTLTTITVDGDDFSATTGARVSNGLLRIWRGVTSTTTVYSFTQFFALEDALSVPISGEVYVDTIPDADLGFIQTSIKPVNIQYPFARGKVISSHQGVLVVSNNQTLNWEDADSPESSPAAISNTKLPTGISGDISGLVSGTDSSLSIFKGTAQYEANGSLPSNEVEITKILENSFGVESPDAIALIEKIIIGAGKLGIFAIDSGVITKGFGKEFLNLLKTILVSADPRYRLIYSKIIIKHDPIKNWIHFFIPFERFSTASWVNTHYTIDEYSRHLVYMISPTEDQANCWAEFEYYKAQQANAGMAVISNEFYQQSSLQLSGSGGQSAHTGFLHKRLDRGSSKDFLDNTRTYTWDYTSEWDDAGSPKVSKFWNDFALYQVQPDFFVDSFNVSFESYRDWDFTKIDSQRTLAFTSSDTEKIAQLDKGYKAQRRSFKLSGTINKNPPLFTGYEYTVDERTYKSDRMVKNE